MQYTVALLALVASAVATSTGPPIPTCGWTSTVITESDHTETVPIPLASADCSTTAYAMTTPPSPTATASTPAAATTPAEECSEYVDGQPQCTTATAVAECSEYVDGQPQCSSVSATPTSTPAEVCSEYVDGQPQCSSTAAVVPSYGTGTAVAPASSYTGPQISVAGAAMQTAAPVLMGALGILALI